MGKTALQYCGGDCITWAKSPAPITYTQTGFSLGVLNRF